MKPKRRYLRFLFIPALARLIMAFINFQMSFAMFDLVTAATAGNWDLFWDHSIVALAYTLALFPASILLAYTRGRFIQGALGAMKADQECLQQEHLRIPTGKQRTLSLRSHQ
ncbi:MAG: hypothetical protein WC251_01450 [Candidatus Izemoplasmatales bacterium]|jgi:hypothetical protein